jgi:hypothetical protein
LFFFFLKKVLPKIDAAKTLTFNLARNWEIIRRTSALKDRKRQSRILQATGKVNHLE